MTLNRTAAWALEKLFARAMKECGCSMPEHYLIPRHNRDHIYDPTRPVESRRGGLDHLLGVAGIDIRPYDFRHHAVSRSLGDPRVPLEAAKRYYGWISPKMIERYYHADVTSLQMVATAVDGVRATQAERQVLRNQDVIERLSFGLPAEIVVAKVKASARGFDTSIQALKSLRTAGVPNSVILAMVQAG